jgi:hypothetical protein
MSEDINEGVDHMGLMFKFITEIDGSGNIKPSEEVELMTL